MRKRACLAVLLSLLVSCVACSTPAAPPEHEPEPEPPAGADPAQSAQLARRFCPVIHLKMDGEAIEHYEPQQAEMMIDEALLRDIEDPSFTEKATLATLLRWSKGIYYLDLTGIGPETHSADEYRRAYDELKGSYHPTVYARVLEGVAGGYTVLQYWMFYYFNEWRNLHEGDWELVQLCFPGHTVEEILKAGEEPVFAAYSQHQAGQRMSWSDMKANGLASGTHPEVYVARGSHASYFMPGQSWSVLDFDDTGLSSWRVVGPEQLDIVLLPQDQSQEEGPQWLEFKGYWGEYLDFSISIEGLTFWVHGPFGPSWSEDEQPREKWGQPVEWATGLPEYPQPFWTSFFDLPGDWLELAFFSIFSPADIHVYDSSGRHVGMNEQGELERQIPGAVYIAPEGTQYKTIAIPDADVSQEYEMVATGTGAGTMEMKAQVPDAANEVRRYLEYTGVPVSATTVARVDIAPELVLPRAAPGSASVRDTVTRLKLDMDGDGIMEVESAPGSFEGQELVLPELRAEVDIEPEKIDLGGIDNQSFIAAFIELPRDYHPKEIDISTVRLLKDIAPREKPVEIVDHDRDGVAELMVTFDLRPVLDRLMRDEEGELKVSLPLTGVVDGRRFAGTGTIVIFRSPQKPPADGQDGLLRG